MKDRSSWPYGPSVCGAEMAVPVQLPTLEAKGMRPATVFVLPPSGYQGPLARLPMSTREGRILGVSEFESEVASEASAALADRVAALWCAGWGDGRRQDVIVQRSSSGLIAVVVVGTWMVVTQGVRQRCSASPSSRSSKQRCGVVSRCGRASRGAYPFPRSVGNPCG